ncbi:hypothetical protein Q31b_28780 [Novipirellula aureliae]|uniref:Uncharacterized protein n=1 Tax=Novipirellula aureliae TaxID=2527966 RepID=A0A5C6E1A0_9BACT|nr:hypothetical protein Q31b_28780 [Novipirellula aureliae]
MMRVNRIYKHSLGDDRQKNTLRVRAPFLSTGQFFVREEHETRSKKQEARAGWDPAVIDENADTIRFGCASWEEVPKKI